MDSGSVSSASYTIISKSVVISDSSSRLLGDADASIIDMV